MQLLLRSHFPFLVSLAAVSIFVLIVFSGFVFLIFSKKDEVAALVRERALIEKEEQHYREIKRALADTKTARETLQGFFVNPENFVPFIEDIEALGTHAGAAIATEGAEVAENGKNLTLTLLATGDFGEIVYFLSLLEALPAHVSFARAWIAKAPRQETRHSWEGKFIVSFASI